MKSKPIGADMKEASQSLEPKRIEHNGDITIVTWSDGEQTTVKRAEGDKPDNYIAFCAALARRVYGKNSDIWRLIEKAENVEPERLKVGDIVEVLDGATIPDYAGGWAASMDRYIGKRAKVTSAWDSGRRVNLNNGALTFDYRGLRLISRKES